MRKAVLQMRAFLDSRADASSQVLRLDIVGCRLRVGACLEWGTKKH